MYFLQNEPESSGHFNQWTPHQQVCLLNAGFATLTFYKDEKLWSSMGDVVNEKKTIWQYPGVLTGCCFIQKVKRI